MSSPTEKLSGEWRAESGGAPVAIAPAPAGASDPAPAPEGVEWPASAGQEDTAPGVDLVHPLVQDLLLNPTRWRIWPAVAVLRWMQRRTAREELRIVYRSRPSLGFSGSEIHDIAIDGDRLELILNAPGLAAAGSPLPPSDIARIIADKRNGGALSAWLDGPGDLFMQVLEAMQARSNAPFALSTGGRIEAHALAADLVGRSAVLAAGPGGALYDSEWLDPGGAVGLAALFLGPISAAGLAGLFRAFTGLPVRIEEFTGAEVATLRPARVGLRMGMMLGSRCRLPSAGIEAHIEGGSDPDSQEWARDPVRRRSLRLLAMSYIGAPSPAVRVLLWLDAGNAPPVALADGAALGGLAVLGEAGHRVELPLEG